MIYLDVTSASRSALNTGVKRVQRGLHDLLRSHHDYQPICWDSVRHRYHLIDAREQSTLEQAHAPAGLALFDSFAPGAWKDWTSLTLPSRAARKPVEFRSGDLLFLPDLLWDNRARFLPHIRVDGLRRIAIFHDAIALREPVQSRVDRFFCHRAMRSLAAFDGVLCVSAEAESDLLGFWRKQGLAPSPTRVAPWPVPFTGSRPTPSANFAGRRILYVARLEPHKNHLRLLHACEQLWNSDVKFELQLVGCLAYPDAAWKILRLVRKLKKAGFPIRWQAHLDETELHRAYHDCSFTAFPSLIEGFGLPILESLWFARPVVCGANGALGEVSQGGGCLNVDTRDPSALAVGLRALLENETHYQRLYSEARDRTFSTWADYGHEISDFCGMPISTAN